MSVVDYIKNWVEGAKKEGAKKEEAHQNVDARDSDVEVVSDSRAFKDFVEGQVWKDLEAFIKVRLYGYRDALEITKDHNDIIHIQGEIYSYRTMLDLPYTIIQMLERRERVETDDA